MTGSILDITLMASDPEHNLRNRNNLSLRAIYANLVLTRQNVHDNMKSQAHVLESKQEDLPSVQAQGQDPAPAPLELSLKCLGNAKLCAKMRQTAHKKTERIHASRVKESTPKAAEDGLSDASFVGLDTANDGLKTASFCFLELIVMKIAQNCALDEVFNRSIEH